jgi:hypothetical protein
MLGSTNESRNCGSQFPRVDGLRHMNLITSKEGATTVL